MIRKLPRRHARRSRRDPLLRSSLVGRAFYATLGAPRVSTT